MTLGILAGSRDRGGVVSHLVARYEIMNWVTTERPVIDRIACPWLIARFIDKQPDFSFVPPDQVTRVAAERGAIPYDIPGVELTHVGEGCSFDSFVSKYDLGSNPA